jgi:hypothetical protein
LQKTIATLGRNTDGGREVAAIAAEELLLTVDIEGAYLNTTSPKPSTSHVDRPTRGVTAVQLEAEVLRYAPPMSTGNELTTAIATAIIQSVSTAR